MRNRQLNTAVHRIAVTQIHLDGLGRTCHDKKMTEGEPAPEALRRLERRLSRIVFSRPAADQTATKTAIAVAA